MPGPTSRPGSQGNAPTSAEAQFANYLATKTGLDPRVILTWTRGEGNPGDLPGYYNYLNIQAATAAANNDPITGVGPANTAKFGSLSAGEKAALDELNALGLSHEQGKTIAQQFTDIGNSPWASSHYGNPPGQNLLNDFKNFYPGIQPGTAADPGAKVTSGTGIPNPIAPITDAIGSITDAFKFIFSLRFLEILGGGLLILLGLYLLGKQFGVSVPAPPAAKAAAAAIE
jgi:hypothetical protein